MRLVRWTFFVEHGLIDLFDPLRSLFGLREKVRLHSCVVEKPSIEQVISVTLTKPNDNDRDVSLF